MNFIQLHNGKRYYLGGPDAFDARCLDINTIAVALSRLPRFCGHLRTNINVAQHSVGVAVLSGSMQGLLHDAAEIITGDIPRPVKLMLGEQLKELETKIWHSIADRFDVPRLLELRVKHADNYMLLREAGQCCIGRTSDWDRFEIGDVDGAALSPYLFALQSPGQSAEMFLQQYRLLGGRA